MMMFQVRRTRKERTDLKKGKTRIVTMTGAVG